MSPKPDAQQIAQLSMPSYCIKSIGSRHFLVGGGGGAAKTGVKNEIQVYLLTYNSLSSLKSSTMPNLRAKMVSSIDTKARSNMNCDVYTRIENGKQIFIAAAGQDEYCQLYVAQGYDICDQEDELESPAQLTLNFKPLFKIITDFANSDPYQKCVRFDRSQGQYIRAATGGTDGYVRVWDVGTILSNPDPRIEHKPQIEFRILDENKVEVDDLDISLCGRYISTVSAKESALWDMSNGKKLCVVQVPQHLVKDFKVRSIRFTEWGRHSTVFAVAFQQRQRTSKQVSYIGLFGYNAERKAIHGFELNEVCKEAVSCMSINSQSQHLAIGTMEGSVYCFNSQLKPIYTAIGAHKSFVTAVEFLPDAQIEAGPSDGPKVELPGPGADAKCIMLSLSVDQMVKSHRVPWPRSIPFTQSVFKLSIYVLILYIFLEHFIPLLY